MQENGSLNANLIIQRIKKSLKITTDIQLSEFLNIKPNTISTWKKRNSLDYASIISICELYEIDLNEIFLEGKNVRKESGNYISETPLIGREVQFQYCIGGGIVENLPKYNFPFVRSEHTRAFQVLSNNMFPIVEENSFVVCESCDIDNLPENSIVVIISKAKGLFINRLARGKKPHTYILSSENPFFNQIYMDRGDINEIWLIKGVLAYNINAENTMQIASSKPIKSIPGT